MKYLLIPFTQYHAKRHHTSILHDIKRFPRIWRNNDRGSDQLFLQLFKYYHTRIIKVKFTLLFKKLAERMCEFCKIFYEPPIEPTFPWKLLTPFIEIGGGSFYITSTLDLSTSIPFSEFRWSNTMTFFIIKWNFS